jgi:Flp pilus assembly protein TadD
MGNTGNGDRVLTSRAVPARVLIHVLIHVLIRVLFSVIFLWGILMQARAESVSPTSNPISNPVLADPQDLALEPMRVLVEAGEGTLARIQLEGYLKTHPGQLEALLLLSRSLLLEGKAKAALAPLLAFTQTEGSSAGPEYNWVLGQVLLELGQYREALSQLRLGATYGSDYRYAMDWAAAAWRLGQPVVALTAYTRASELSPLEPWPLLNQGMILYSQDKISDALERLKMGLAVLKKRQIITPHPAYVELYFWIGQCYMGLGKRKEAKNAYQTALSYDPNHFGTLRALEKLSEVK